MANVIVIVNSIDNYNACSLGKEEWGKPPPHKGCTNVIPIQTW